MNVIYQRELYRSEVCFELEQKETMEDYALEMCLRNPIPGLLPCHLSRQDGKVFLCWDVTSRISLKKQLESGGMSAQLLMCLIRGMDEARLSLEKYLIDPGALFPDPEFIFTDASGEQMYFVLNFEAPGGFRERWQQLAENLLQKISHRDQEQMRLAYGFYRLSVGEVYDEAGIRELLAGKGEDVPLPQAETPAKAEEPQNRQREIVEQFLKEEEKSTGKRLRLPNYLPVYGSVLFILFAGMETIGYYRGGHHLSLSWIVFGIVLWLVATAASAGIDLLLSGRQNRSGEDEETSFRAFETEVPAPAPARPPQPEKAPEPAAWVSSDTVYLGVYELDLAQKIPVVASIESGEVFRLNPGGTIIGKMPDVADLVLPRATVSRIHARIYRQGERWLLEDLNSRNGTTLNGQPVPGGNPRELSEHDRIVFADAAFEFRLETERSDGINGA